MTVRSVQLRSNTEDTLITLGDKNALPGYRIVLVIEPTDDASVILAGVSEIMDEDFEDDTVRLDAIHSLIHLAKRLNILPLRTV